MLVTTGRLEGQGGQIPRSRRAAKMGPVGTVGAKRMIMRTSLPLAPPTR